ncbi:MAG: autotransporter assembly complex protein TamA [Gammaproteobacteria bacterium]|nr:autotransporter assembly complex protein TamA [Gammaproteobacteria bacterium]
MIGLALLLCSFAAAASAADVEVQVQGVTGAVKDNVLASLSLVHYRQYGEHPAATIRRLYTRAEEEIRQALKPFGYFSPRVESRLTHEGENWTASFHIATGEPVLIRRVTVKVTGPGSSAPAFRAVVARSAMKPGTRLEQAEYTRSRQLLKRVATEKGWFDAHFTAHSLTVDPKELWADVKLVMATGERYRFGEIRIHQKILDPDLVNRYVHIRPGEPYDATELADLQSALAASGYFSSVIVDPKKKQARRHRVPIDVQLSPAERNHVSIGVGYGTDTGPRLSLGWEVRRLNRSGHRLRFDTRISGIQTQAVARYIVPLENPATESMVYSATLGQQDYGDTVSHLLGVGANRITMYGGWQQNLFLNAHRYISEIGNSSFTTRLLIPGIRFSHVEAQPPTRPRHGFSVDGMLSGSTKILASDANFLRVDVSTRFIFPLGPGRLLLHGEIGAIAAGDFSEIPVALRFYTGGSTTVRGYDYQSLGPRNAAGLVVGGQFLRVASVEYDFPIADNWALAGFVDAGSASNSFSEPLNFGVGIGVRYFTPVGAIRLDFAHPVDHPELSPIHIHLSIGLAL